MPNERYETYKTVRAMDLMMGDVIVEPCGIREHEACEGVHERLVRELATTPRIVLAVTQDDAGEFLVRVMSGCAKLRVLNPRPRKPMSQLSEEELRGLLGVPIAPVVVQGDGGAGSGGTEEGGEQPSIVSGRCAGRREGEDGGEPQP